MIPYIIWWICHLWNQNKKSASRGYFQHQRSRALKVLPLGAKPHPFQQIKNWNNGHIMDIYNMNNFLMTMYWPWFHYRPNKCSISRVLQYLAYCPAVFLDLWIYATNKYQIMEHLALPALCHPSLVENTSDHIGCREHFCKANPNVI